MFERFTERARQVVVLAQDEARRLRHDYIGTEHLLLALLREEKGVAARVLESLDITVEEVRAQIARIVGQGDEVTTGQIPFTPRAKNVLELSLREAMGLGHNYISTEHILLGLVREGRGMGARILRDFDADADTVRAEVLRALDTPRGGRESDGADDNDEDFYGEAFEFVRPPAGGWAAYAHEVGGEVGVPWHVRWQAPLLLSISLAAIGFPLGLLVGFLIWG